MKYVFEVASDLTVVGYDPERADLDCPNGEIIGERYYMMATTRDGATRVWGWHASPEKLERDFEFCAPAVDEWQEGRPRYGSRAFEAANQDFEDLQSEMRAAMEEPFRDRFSRVY